MRIPFAATALALALCFLLSAAAFAQYSDDDPTRLNIKAGMFRPSDSITQEASGKTWTSLQAIYDLKLNEETGRPRIQLGFGMMESLDTDDKITTLDVTWLWWRKSGEENAFYFGTGTGLWRLDVFGEKELKPAAQLVIGYNIRDSYFAEVRHISVPTMDAFDAKLSGLSISVGTRKLF